MSDNNQSNNNNDVGNDLQGLNARESMTAHGPSAYLVKKVSFYGLLGWGLFGVMLLANVVTAFIFLNRPAQVLTLDKTGRVVGEVQLLAASTRAKSDYLGASKRFVEAFLSHNSATVAEDKYLALSMMSEPLRQKWQDTWFELNVVNDIQDQKVHCVVLLDENKTTFKQALNNTFFMSAVGDIACGDKAKTRVPFTLDFSAQPHPVSWNQTSGIEIINLFNNPFDSYKDNEESNENVGD